ncbi:MAG TPA: DMT family transporter [Longimicrobiales bacterium]|nr:DMT family transporter [Longimicrobiales bacterium]
MKGPGGGTKVSRRRVILGLVLVQIMFATLPIAAKIGLRGLSTSSLVLVRVTVAALVFFIIQRLTIRERIRSRVDLLHLAFYSVLGVSLNQLLYVKGLSLTTATAAQMLIAGGPAVTLMLAILIGRERASPTKWIGIVLAASGALLLVSSGGGEARWLGNTLILINVVAYSMYLVFARDILTRYHPLTVITWIFIFGIVGLLPFGLLPAMREIPAAGMETKLALLWIIVFPTVCAYYLNMWALTVVESSLVSTFVYLQPVMTALLAMWILRERPTLSMVPAAVLIFSGVGFSIWSSRREDHQPHPEDQAVIEV